MISSPALGAFCVIFFGYIANSLFLQYWFYYRRKESSDAWKIQPTKSSAVGRLWGFPLLSSKPNRGPYHRFLTAFNLFVASMAALVTTECSVRGWNRMSFGEVALSQLLGQVIIACTYECIVEYYWHCFMHTRLCYAAFHKMHHHYKAPEPWDDMYIHPLEAFGYYCILYGPPFLFAIHCRAFIAYMVIMGLCGVLDHAGIHFDVPGLYNTVDHDNHHAKFEVNYAFPFPYMDLLHGTYEGVFLGRRFSRKHTIWSSWASSSKSHSK